MTTIGSIGIGLFILILVWIIALIVFVVAINFQSNIAWISLSSATSITVLLLIIPTEKTEKVDSFETEVKDYAIIYKNILLTFLVLNALAGLVAFFVLHCIEPVRAKPIKTFDD